MSPAPVEILRPDYQTASFIGVGAGRCGTLSLAKILSECAGVECWHEGYATTPGRTVDVGAMFQRLDHYGPDLHGQVGVLWLSLIPLIRVQYPHVKVVCLHRDKDATVASFMDRQAHRDRPWILNMLGIADRLTPEFVAAHWEWAQREMAKIPGPVLHMDMTDLNDDGRLCELYEFLYVAKRARSYPKQRVWHRGLSGMPEVGGTLEAVQVGVGA